MTDSDDKNKEQSVPWDNELLFTQLVLSFQAAAWQQMGKVPSVISGKIERDLAMAKHSIDMLGMLEAKTATNLNENEAKLLSHMLYELRMNYLDELKKGSEEKTEEKAASGPPDEPGI